MIPFDVYPLLDITPVSALGSKVIDNKGVSYLDLYGGHAVISIGHSHPHYVARIQEQLQKIAFYSNSVQNPLQQELAKKLGTACGYPDYGLFLCNSGAEANENALKTAAFHTGRSKILAFSKAFHGRTMGAVACTDNPNIRSPFHIEGSVDFLPFNHIEALQAALETREYAAVIIEGIQGVAGIIPPSDAFLHALQSLCHSTQTLLILDEIQSGYGRTGLFFAHQHAGIRADIITMAKGMGNGFPIGGLIISPEIKAVHGRLGTTFGGNHLACAAALAVLEVLEAEKLLENASRIGAFLLQALSEFSDISAIRGRGLMIGFDLPQGQAGLRKELLQSHHCITGAAGALTIRLLPALSLSMDEAAQFIQALRFALQAK
jgi:Ornithine/acetylornithine aminotransferase